MGHRVSSAWAGISRVHTVATASGVIWALESFNRVHHLAPLSARSPRDGKTIEEVGFYHPIEMKEKQVTVKEERIRDWLAKGALPSDTVRKLLNNLNFRMK